MFQENESSVFRDPDLDALYSFLFPPLLFLEHHSVYARNSKRINHTTLFCSVLSVISRTKDMICVRIFISVLGMIIKALHNVYMGFLTMPSSFIFIYICFSNAQGTNSQVFVFMPESNFSEADFDGL